MDVRSRKRLVRRATLERVLALDPADRATQESVLTARFATLPGLGRAERVLLYVSAFADEPETRSWLGHVLESGKTLICPRVDRPARRLRLFVVEDVDADLKTTAMGIGEPSESCVPVEPSQVDWVLVPGVAFDARCARLGRGGGYYDRLLPLMRPEVPRWSLVFDEQWCDDLPLEPHDALVDGVVSPSRSAVRTPAGYSPWTSTLGGSE
jgi:5-formyltetrahydrofolate cyclo-ligase